MLPPGWTRVAAVLGAAGVLGYVLSWGAAGVLYEGYDPLRQAISELFARGAPAVPSWLLRGALVVTGILLVPLAAALHRGLPGTGWAGPVSAALSGVLTVAVAFFPCTAGCPGAGATVTDTAHALTAGGAYLTLIAAPLLFAWRLRGHDDRFAGVSAILGALALAGFLAHASGVADGLAGLQQRVFNTVADAWYVLAAVRVLRGVAPCRPGTARPRRSAAGRRGQERSGV